MNSDMDKLLAYRNFLAAEDHLSELYNRSINSNEKFAIDNMMTTVEVLRRHIMPEEKDPRFHCVVKHLSVAYEACREIRQNDTSLSARNTEYLCYDVLIDALERLWGRKINLCERCTNGTGRIQEEDTGSDDVSTVDGVTRDFIQGIGDDREPSVSSSEVRLNGREQDSDVEREIAGREG